jgi:hypothetical protein
LGVFSDSKLMSFSAACSTRLEACAVLTTCKQCACTHRIARPQQQQPAAAPAASATTTATAIDNATAATSVSAAPAVPAAAAPSTSAAAPLTEFTLIDELMAAAQSQFSKFNNKGDSPQTDPSVPGLLSPDLLAVVQPLSMLSLALAEPPARVYLRSSGLLAQLISMVVTLASSIDSSSCTDSISSASAGNSSASSVGSDPAHNGLQNLPENFLEQALTALAEAVRSERRSQLAAYSSGAVAAATLLLSAHARNTTNSSSGSSSSSAAAVSPAAAAAAVRFVGACCSGCDDVKRGCCADTALFSGVLHVLKSKGTPPGGLLAAAEFLRDCLLGGNSGGATSSTVGTAVGTAVAAVAAAVPEVVGTVCTALSRALPGTAQHHTYLKTGDTLHE